MKARILSSAFVWIGSATHGTSDAFRQRQRERMRQAQRAEVTRQLLPQNNDKGSAAPPVGTAGTDRQRAGPESPFARKNPDSVHFSVEHPDGTVTDYSLKPYPFARKEGK